VSREVGALLFAVVACGLASSSPAIASDSLPHPADGSWVDIWNDTPYSPVATDEAVTVEDQKAGAFSLAWTTQDQGNADGAVQSDGHVSFQENTAGVFVTHWQATPPPQQFPILCSGRRG